MDTSTSKIIELTTRDQWKRSFPVMNQLRTDLDEETYIDYLIEMKKDGYRLFALEVAEEIVSLAGVAVRINFYHKRHVFVYDLVTDSAHRSYGYGEKMLNYIHHWTKEEGINCVSLESGLQRTKAHRFYEDKMNYEKWSYSFRKWL